MSRTRNGGDVRQNEERSPPVFSRKFWTAGGAIEAAVFEKTVTGEKGKFSVHNVTLKRTYRDGDEYKEAKGFRYDDLPWIILALQQCCAFIAEQDHRK